MSEYDFQQAVIDRLARIETKQDYIASTVSKHSEEIELQGKLLVEATSSTKSAHHRIDGVYAAAASIGAVAGAGINWLVSYMSGKN